MILCLTGVLFHGETAPASEHRDNPQLERKNYTVALGTLKALMHKPCPLSTSTYANPLLSEHIFIDSRIPYEPCSCREVFIQSVRGIYRMCYTVERPVCLTHALNNKIQW